MQDCSYSSQIGAYHDNELEAGPRKQVEAHLGECAPCRAELRSLQRLTSQFTNTSLQDMTPIETERLRRSLPTAAEASPLPFWGGLMAIAASILVVCGAWWSETPTSVPGNVTIITQEPWERVAVTLRVEPQPGPSEATAVADAQLADWMLDNLSREETHGATRARSLLLVTFVVALGTGVAAGMIVSRNAGGRPMTTNPPHDHSALADDLQLSSEQREQMRSIWEGTRGQAHTCFDEAQSLQKGRDDALVALLNDEQKAQYEKITKDYADRFAALTAKREAMFQEAVEKTKQMLNPTQREKYEQILASRKGGPPMGGKDLFPPRPHDPAPAPDHGPGPNGPH